MTYDQGEYLHFKLALTYPQMIEEKIVIEFYDQNDEMEKFLPRYGTIMRKLQSADWGKTGIS